MLQAVGGFHDGVLKEVHWVNRDYVDESLNLLPCQLAHARMLVQRQRREFSAVEIYFENVWSLVLDTADFIYGSTAGEELSPPHSGQRRPLLRLDLEASRITFERLFWRDASDLMGAEPRFGPFAMPDAAG